MRPEGKRRRKSLDEELDVKKAKANEPSYAFLETIDKRRLDFDAEKVCSVSLSRLNVYCCLVCGKYLQGRRENSPAFLHSVDEDHHVFANLNSLKFYLLPDGIEIKDNGRIQLLNSIRYAIRPRFTKDEINHFPRECQDLNNHIYFNGFVGVTNPSRNTSFNVVLLALSHLQRLRDYCLIADIDGEDELTKKLSIIIRKIWSVRLFKQQVSADEFIAYLTVSAIKNATNVDDPRLCLLWLFDLIRKNTLTLKEILIDSCQGKVLVTKTAYEAVLDEAHNIKKYAREESSQSNTVPFWILTLDLPPRPLFKGGINANDLPQVRLEDLMSKFDGKTEKQMSNFVVQYQLVDLPKYMILHFDRFEKKDQHPVRNRNHTLVEFPLTMKIQGLTYSLLANIVHQAGNKSTGNNTSSDKDYQSNWIIQLHNSATGNWVEIAGTEVRIKNKELLFLNETYIQIWAANIDLK